jgi:hypothetical protein
MSNPGMMPNTSQMTPEYMQQMQAMQDQQRKMAMAQSLMGNQAQGQNAGMANIGNDILGAMRMKSLQQQNSPENAVVQQRYGMSPSQANGVLNPSLGSRIGGMFGLGGS